MTTKAAPAARAIRAATDRTPASPVLGLEVPGALVEPVEVVEPVEPVGVSEPVGAVVESVGVSLEVG